MTSRNPRILFGSYHCYLDPSSGAALSVRDLFQLLAPRGWHCRACCGPLLDFEYPLPVEQLLTDPRFAAAAGATFTRAPLPAPVPSARCEPGAPSREVSVVGRAHQPKRGNLPEFPPETRAS